MVSKIRGEGQTGSDTEVSRYDEIVLLIGNEFNGCGLTSDVN